MEKFQNSFYRLAQTTRNKKVQISTFSFNVHSVRIALEIRKILQTKFRRIIKFGFLYFY